MNLKYEKILETLDTTKQQDYSNILKKEIEPNYVYKLAFVNVLINLCVGLIGYFIVDLPIWMSFFGYIAGGLVFYLTHWLGHQTWFKLWYKAHTIGHHQNAYSCKTFLSTEYAKNTVDKYNLNTYLYAFGGLTLIGLTKYLFNLSISQTLVFAVYITFNLLTENWIHNEMHLQNSWLNKYQWFQKLRYMHFLHHKGNMKKNYAMRDFILDILTNNVMTK